MGLEKRYLVSAIVSTYNAERFIGGKLEDLEAQSIADRLEIIVIDSASPQNERAVVEEFQKRYDNIRYLRTEKRETVYQAWNRGIRMASGEFVTNANTDDRLRPDALEILSNALIEHPDRALAYGDILITEKENETFANHTSYGHSCFPEYDPLYLLELCCIGPFPMWRRSLHDELGYFDERLKSAADYEFWLRAALKHQFIHVPYFVGLYWLSPETVSRKGDLPTLEYFAVQKLYRPKYAALTPPPPPVPAEAERELERLVQLADGGRLDDAIDGVQGLLESYPRWARGFHDLAELHYKKNDLGPARKYFEKAAILDPRDAALAEKLATFMRFELYRSLQIYTSEAAKKPEAVTYLTLAMICQLTDRFEMARQYYGKALELDPDNAVARQNVEELLLASPSQAETSIVGWAPRAHADSGSGGQDAHPTVSSPPQTSPPLEGEGTFVKCGPKVSIVILTWNEMERTRECLESIRLHTPEPHEIVLVDNGSTDGTLPWLRELCREDRRCRLVENGRNLGFAGGCNVGISHATGDCILLLNNDTVVTDGWLGGMLRHLERDPDLGLVGPMSNNVSAPQRIRSVPYRTMEEMQEFSRAFRASHLGRRIPIDRVAGFCMLMPASLVQHVGVLDESFSTGNDEDNDFCLRTRLAGYGIAIAGDVFIHHHGSRSFAANGIDYTAMMRKNRQVYDAKWHLTSLEEALAKKLVTKNAVSRATILAQRGESAKAVDLLLNEGIAFSPADPAPYRLLAEILANGGDFKGAVDVLERMPVDSAAVPGGQGTGTFGASPLSGSECDRHLRSGDRHLRSQSPGYRAAFAGVCRLRLGETAVARDLSRRALEVAPDCALSLHLAALVALQDGRSAEGEELLRKAIAADPGFAPPHAALARIARDTGDAACALTLAETSFMLAPCDLETLALYHQLASEAGRTAEEESRIREALDLFPEHRGLAFALIDLLLGMGRLDEAMADIERAAATFGADEAMLDASLSVRRRLGPLVPARQPGRPTLSVCMIVKDEAKHLCRCLASVRGLADEIVVVDTGSTDRSADLAALFGARVFSFPWQGNFAAARNASLTQATCDWILVLDADEVLAQRDLARVRELVASPPAAYCMVTRNYTESITRRRWHANCCEYLAEEAGQGWTPSDKIRLFPNDARIRFKGAVHELVEESVHALGLPILPCDVPVHHYGKMDQVKGKEKQKHYFELGVRKLAENTGDVKALTELAIQATELGLAAEGFWLWERVLALEPHNCDAFFNLGYLKLDACDFRGALSSSRRAFELDPQLKEAAFNAAKSELFLGETRSALASARDMLQRWPDYPPAQALVSAVLLMAGDEAGSRMVEELSRKGYDCADYLRELAGGLEQGGLKHFAAPLLAEAQRVATGSAQQHRGLAPQVPVPVGTSSTEPGVAA